MGLFGNKKDEEIQRLNEELNKCYREKNQLVKKIKQLEAEIDWDERHIAQQDDEITRLTDEYDKISLALDDFIAHFGINPEDEHIKEKVIALLAEKRESKNVENKQMDQEKIQLTNEQQYTLVTLLETKNNYFITGKAGTGKSTILKEYLRCTPKKNVVVTAFTGAAAINVGGQTIHSLFRMDIGPQDTARKASCPDIVKNILASIEVLVIDEVSMVRADIMDMIDARLRFSKGNDLPYGGCQVIVFGDLFQLPPIAGSKEEEDYIRQKYGTLFFFGAPAVKDTFKMIELKEVLRQKDNSFIDVLNWIRDGGGIDTNGLMWLNSRCVKPIPEDWLHLTLKKSVANQINLTRLSLLPSDEVTFETELGGNEPPSAEDVPFDYVLKIKVGARIMMTKNDPTHKYHNGSIGTVELISSETIHVNINGQSLPIERAVWDKRKYKKNGSELTEEIVGWARQFPMRLAYAITIHKSQGQTYDNVVIDYSDCTAFSPGQTYVALSRCRTIDGIRLTRPLDPKDVYASREVFEYMKKMRQPQIQKTLWDNLPF